MAQAFTTLCTPVRAVKDSSNDRYRRTWHIPVKMKAIVISPNILGITANTAGSKNASSLAWRKKVCEIVLLSYMWVKTTAGIYILLNPQSICSIFVMILRLVGFKSLSVYDGFIAVFTLLTANQMPLSIASLFSSDRGPRWQGSGMHNKISFQKV